MADAKRILVVEDETIIALMIEDSLSDWGFSVVGPASRLAAALDLAERAPIDAAVLDVNIAGELVYPVAHKLAQRAIPIIFLTGYGVAGIDPAFAACPVLTKPVDLVRLRSVLSRLL